jgi:hypothetical protein
MSYDARRKPTRVAMSTYHELQSFGNNDLTFVNVITGEPGSSANTIEIRSGFPSQLITRV